MFVGHGFSRDKNRIFKPALAADVLPGCLSTAKTALIEKMQ